MVYAQLKNVFKKMQNRVILHHFYQRVREYKAFGNVEQNLIFMCAPYIDVKNISNWIEIPLI